MSIVTLLYLDLILPTNKVSQMKRLSSTCSRLELYPACQSLETHHQQEANTLRVVLARNDLVPCAK